MNFCIATLILKVEENIQYFWHILLYYFKNSRNATDMQKKVCAVCGEGAVTDRTCQKWFAQFRAGDFSLTVLHSQVDCEVSSDRIDTSVENNQHYTMREIANILKISKLIKLLVKMKNVSFMEKKAMNFLANPILCLERLFLLRL